MQKKQQYIKKKNLISKQLGIFFNPKNNIIIFDIGACEGLDSIKYSLQFPNSKIYSFEPLKGNIEIIKKNLVEYKIKNVNIVDKALSNKVSKEFFYVSSASAEKNEPDWNYGNKSSSLYEPNKELIQKHYKWLQFKKKIEVETTTIYEFCINKNIQTIDFIHMDVQGAELNVLDGAKKILNNILLIWLEVENIELYKNQPLKKEIENFMHQWGFKKLVDTVNYISGDQLYINKKLYIQKYGHTKFYKNFIKTKFRTK